MRRILTLITILLSSLGLTAQTQGQTAAVTEQAQYDEEMAYARQWLLKEGKHPDSLSLQLIVSEEDLYVFEDRRHRCFCIVGNKKIWPLIGEPVLAYSTEGALYVKGDERNFDLLMQPFRQQIEALKKGNAENDGSGVASVTNTLYQRKHNTIAPLLGGVQWGQGSPYNLVSPTFDGKKTLVGCVPLAVALILNYHQWPEQGCSHVYYQARDKKIYQVDYADFRPDWKSYKPRYESNDTTGTLKELSKILTFLGLSIDADFKVGSTSAVVNKVKHTMCNNLGYSGRLHHYVNLTDMQTEALLHYELDHQRPCIVSCGGHSFVCDGYKGDFMHYNLGWSGHYNGYYRLRLGQFEEAERPMILVKQLLAGIEPKREEMRREVTLQKAGTLQQMLSEEEQQQVTAMKISGPLNSADIRLIRKMAGAVEGFSLNDWQGGSLTRLDLSEATITNDKEPYLKRRLSGGRTHRYTTQSGVTKTVRYDYEKMTEGEWRDFKRDIGDVQDGYFYTRSDDNHCWINYPCQKNCIGAYMFLGCSSLQSVNLPVNTRTIGEFAFYDCCSLQTIIIPRKTSEVGMTPFCNCTSLESISVPEGLNWQGKLYDKCSPALKYYTRY